MTSFTEGDPHLPIRSALIRVLGDQGPQTAKALIERHLKGFTKQGIYSGLRKLMAEGAVIKAEKLYALRFVWVLEMHAAIERMYQTAVKQGDILWTADDSNKKRWVLPDLGRALHLWTQLTMTLFRRGESSQLLEWAPHSWYHFISSPVEVQFQSAIKRFKVGFFLIVGGDTPLDKSYRRYFNVSGHSISFGHKPFGDLKDTCFSVIGDNIITVRTSPRHTQLIAKLFAESCVNFERSTAAASRVLLSPSRTTVMIERNATQARRLRKIFENHFGKL